MQQSATIQRQYDEVIATHYDTDPQNVTTDALNRALKHLEETGVMKESASGEPLRVLDLGMGTGKFLARLSEECQREVVPCGVDLSANMIDIAKEKLPGLEAYVDDAANFDSHFGDKQFDVICTHFITGFVPIDQIAPLIRKRLRPGGCWSFVGASKEAYPQLRGKADSRIVKVVTGGDGNGTDSICPDDEAWLKTFLKDQSFDVAITETFEPELWFPNFDAFMEYAYTGGWLTPFIEDMGLHKAGRMIRTMLNAFVFPIKDHHRILQAIAVNPDGQDQQ